ncbi:MAG TPA: phosphopantothenoylcysteine decarboxylase [Isosphaeraceae bacterium]|jgi:phosphopantothenate-cysteine ligase
MNILVTGGGTVAPIDDVRQITNSSSGRFSSGITEAALERGGRVWHLHTPGAILPFHEATRFDPDADFSAEVDRLRRVKAGRDAVRDNLTLVPLRTGTVPEYAEALRSILAEHPIDVAFLAMAVSDYAPVPGSGKLSSDAEELMIRCRRLPKVICSARDWAPDVFLVGFKLTSGATEEEILARARRANEITRADLTVANDLKPYREGRHTLHLVRPGQPVETLGPAPDLARRLVDRVWKWAGEGRR